ARAEPDRVRARGDLLRPEDREVVRDRPAERWVHLDERALDLLPVYLYPVLAAAFLSSRALHHRLDPSEGEQCSVRVEPDVDGVPDLLHRRVRVWVADRGAPAALAPA